MSILYLSILGCLWDADCTVLVEDLEALNDELVSVVREAIEPAHVSLWLRLDMPRKGEQAD
jgi:hypothetical protein